MLKLILWTAALWYSAHLGFIIYAACRRVYDAGGLTLYWKCIVAPALIVFGILDAVFSLTLGWLMFLDVPRLELFTTKLERMKKRNTWRRELAYFFCDNYNQFDENHC